MFSIRMVKNSQGNLYFLESLRDVPFEIKRVYYITDVPAETVRGNHAHKKLEQVLIALKGRILITLDDGEDRKEILLDSPGKGLIVGKGVWRTMKWLDKDGVLLVLASDYYDEDDYIRDYERFKQMAAEGFWDENKF